MYVVVFQEGGILREKITKICDSFMGERFEIPHGGFAGKIHEIEKKINETKGVMSYTRSEIRSYLDTINRLEDNDDVSAIQVYKWFVLKEKGLYHTLNMLKMGERLFIGLFWVPVSLVEKVKTKILEIKADSNIDGPQMWPRAQQNIKPPTYFRINEFTWAFQEITNTYGIPMYKEVNPSVFSIATFPFLFGVMFGDIGHGTMMALFGVALIWANDSLVANKSALAGLAKGRYIIFLMGVFATFCGLCYNDLMSIPVDSFWGTCFEGTNTDDPSEPHGIQTPGCVYTIGVDYKYYIATNLLTFMNSLKMKIAVILGVAQMSLGVCMKAMNNIYFGQWVDFFFEFIPQIVMLLALFGYMDLLIILKWVKNYKPFDPEAPDIIATMIDFGLKQGKADSYVYGDQSGNPQSTISLILLLVVVICVPVMLCVKPLSTRCKSQHHGPLNEKDYAQVATEEESKGDQPSDQRPLVSAEGGKDKRTLSNIDELLPQDDGGHGHSFGDIFIHQLIETIEFVLGTISNTASYLRLWALSLAHSQLAEVFFD